MVNYHKEFRSLLQSAAGKDIKVYYEAFADKEKIPCISYMESSNISAAEGDTLKYSNISFMVKIWAETIAEIESIFSAIDNTVKNQGFKRTSATETIDKGLIKKIIRYEATGYERA